MIKKIAVVMTKKMIGNLTVVGVALKGSVSIFDRLSKCVIQRQQPVAECRHPLGNKSILLWKKSCDDDRYCSTLYSYPKCLLRNDCGNDYMEYGHLSEK